MFTLREQYLVQGKTNDSKRVKKKGKMAIKCVHGLMCCFVAWDMTYLQHICKDVSDFSLVFGKLPARQEL